MNNEDVVWQPIYTERVWSAHPPSLLSGSIRTMVIEHPRAYSNRMSPRCHLPRGDMTGQQRDLVIDWVVSSSQRTNSRRFNGQVGKY